MLRLQLEQELWSDVRTDSFVHYQMTTTRHSAVRVPSASRVASRVLQSGLAHLQRVEVLLAPEDVVVYKEDDGLQCFMEGK
jgi:hypothetical protein